MRKINSILTWAGRFTYYSCDVKRANTERELSVKIKINWSLCWNIHEDEKCMKRENIK